MFRSPRQLAIGCGRTRTGERRGDNAITRHSIGVLPATLRGAQLGGAYRPRTTVLPKKAHLPSIEVAKSADLATAMPHQHA